MTDIYIPSYKTCCLSHFRQFLWYDDKGKKCKYTAPQYVDYITTYVQKQLSDETLYPTKFGKFY